MTDSHTPGPWIPTMPDGDIVTQSGELVCECHPKNSRLIAAAPDMLAALRIIAETDYVDAALDPQRAVRVAQAAIAQATGATHD